MIYCHTSKESLQLEKNWKKRSKEAKMSLRGNTIPSRGGKKKLVFTSVFSLIKPSTSRIPKNFLSDLILWVLFNAFLIFIMTKRLYSVSLKFTSTTLHATLCSVCSGTRSAVKLGQDRIHFSCVWFLSVQRSTVTPPCPPTNLPPGPNCSTRYTLKLCWCPSIKHGGQGHAEFTELFLDLLQVAWWLVWWRLLPWETVRMPKAIIMFSLFFTSGADLNNLFSRSERLLHTYGRICLFFCISHGRSHITAHSHMCISSLLEPWSVRGVKVHGTSHDQMCRGKQQSWSNGWCQGITASLLVLHGFMRVWPVCRKGVACSHRSQTPARRTCYSIDTHRAEVTKMSATRAFNFWACEEDVG